MANLLLSAAQHAALALEHFFENGKQIEDAGHLSVGFRAVDDQTEFSSPRP